MKKGVSKFWWWNRFVTFLYHKMHGLNPDDTFMHDHLNKCPHCKKGFEKWLAKQDK